MCFLILEKVFPIGKICGVVFKGDFPVWSLGSVQAVWTESVHSAFAFQLELCPIQALMTDVRHHLPLCRAMRYILQFKILFGYLDMTNGPRRLHSQF